MELDVLGPVRVRLGGAALDLGTPRRRAIIAALALGEGRVVPVDVLVDRVWGDDLPPTVTGTLQSYVGGLRRALEPERRPREEATVLVTEHGGYALRVPLPLRDDVRLAEATGRARSLLAGVPDPLRPRTDAAGAAGCREAVGVLDTALGSWRGTPYADLGGIDAVVAERRRLEDLRTAAEELRVVARLALGGHDEVVPDLEAMTSRHPMHERWWTLYAVALVRAGRQADALGALQRLRSVLDDELGVEPSASVRELQTAILRQDPSVAWSAPTLAAGRPAAPQARPPVPVHSRFRVSPPLPSWELAGRSDELDLLTAALDRASAAHAQVVWVTGEAGIGKTRLVHELSLAAFARGFTVATGGCGHVGAPELWPWQQVLTSVADQHGPFEVDVAPWFAVGAAHDFATWHGVAGQLRRAARRDPLCVVLEDVHDADHPTLLLLQHLVATAEDEPLLVVATRRTGAGDDELLQPLAAAVARRGGVRLDLGGLGLSGASDLVAQVTGSRPDEREAAALRERTAGNPFFLVELARAGGAGTGSLTDVVGTRLAGLPGDTRRLLEAAAVVDVRFDEDLVAYVLGLEPPQAGVLLAPAVEAGLVVEVDPVDRVLGFAHAVVRDVVVDALESADRLWLHSRVATVIDERTGLRRTDQRSELARQWALAGHGYGGAAWRSLVKAAEQASRDAQHAEAAGLLEQAAECQGYDHACGDRERYELLMLLLEAQRWSGGWAALVTTVDDAVEVAERLGEPELVARAAMSTVEGAVWQTRPHGVVHLPLVAALERAVVRLDADGSGETLRARARIALATELFYSDDLVRVDALVREAVELAERSQDLRLLSVVLLGAFSTRWRSDTLGWRAGVAARAVDIALELDDARTQAVALGLQACAALESGDAVLLRRTLPAAVALSRRLGLVTVEAVLLAAEVPWRLMEGDDVAVAVALGSLQELAAGSRIPNFDRAVVGTRALVALWQEDEGALTSLFTELASGPEEGLEMGHVVSWVLLRTGQVEAARATLPAEGIDLRGPSYTTVVNAALACEVGWGLGDRDLAARGYAVLAPYAGRMASGGSAMAIGPTDGFLALGARALGDEEAAERHAADARRLGREWGLRRYVRWFDSLDV